MKKQDIIKALQVGLEQSLDIIEHLKGHLKVSGVPEDPIIVHEIEKLQQLLRYANAVQPTQAHSLYTN